MLMRLFTIAAFLSLAVAGATVFLWVRSYRVGDSAQVVYFTAYPDCDLVHAWYATSSAGGLRIAQHVDHFDRGEGARIRGFSLSAYAGPAYPFFGTRSLIAINNHLTLWQRAGFEIGNDSSGTPPSVVQGIILPDWFCAGLFLVVPTLWFWFGRPAIRRRVRVVAGLCSKCGYDLRGSAGRCPECGAMSANPGGNPVRMDASGLSSSL